MDDAGSGRLAMFCELMRRYVREQQQGGVPQPVAVSLLSPPGAAEETDARTMELFPTSAAGVSQPSQERTEAQMTAPLTISYNGRALVFKDFPAEKVQALIQLAVSVSSPAPAEQVAPAVPQGPADLQPSVLSDMPIARKASLQRFLQKRKQHRITTTYPYQMARASPAEEDAAVKPVNDAQASWLGL